MEDIDQEMEQITVLNSNENKVTIEIRKTYKYRIYPTKRQVQQLEGDLAICQKLYNACLQEWRDSYAMWKRRAMGIEYKLLDNGVAIFETDRVNPNAAESEKKPPKVNYFTQSLEFTQLKKDCPEFTRINDKVLRDVIKRAEKTYQAFYRRVKKGEKAGYPRYKSKQRYHSFTYPSAASEDTNGLDKAPGWVLTKNKLTLRRGKGCEAIGPIKIKLHRAAFGRVRTLTIFRKGDEWYACFSVTQQKVLENRVTEPAQVVAPVGVSLGLEMLATLSTGEAIENPRFYQQNRKQLVKAQQSLSCKNEQKKKGNTKETRDNCKNLKKARLKLGKVHRRIANQRLDFAHKLSRKLVNGFDGIVFGNLEIQALTKRAEPQIDEVKSREQRQTVYAPNGQTIEKEYHRAILDAGWATLISLTAYKAEEAGKLCKELEPKDTSQTCCICNWKPDEALAITVREFICGRCGLKILRNLNTAFNLLKKQFGANCAGLAVLREQLDLQKINSSITFNATG